jgi:hypothetical protein
LLMLSDGFGVEFRGLIERCSKVFNLLREPAQQVVTLAGISWP